MQDVAGDASQPILVDEDEAAASGGAGGGDTMEEEAKSVDKKTQQRYAENRERRDRNKTIDTTLNAVLASVNKMLLPPNQANAIALNLQQCWSRLDTLVKSERQTKKVLRPVLLKFVELCKRLQDHATKLEPMKLDLIDEELAAVRANIQAKPKKPAQNTKKKQPRARKKASSLSSDEETDLDVAGPSLMLATSLPIGQFDSKPDREAASKIAAAKQAALDSKLVTALKEDASELPLCKQSFSMRYHLLNEYQQLQISLNRFNTRGKRDTAFQLMTGIGTTRPSTDDDYRQVLPPPMRSPKRWQQRRATWIYAHRTHVLAHSVNDRFSPHTPLQITLHWQRTEEESVPGNVALTPDLFYMVTGMKYKSQLHSVTASQRACITACFSDRRVVKSCTDHIPMSLLMFVDPQSRRSTRPSACTRLCWTITT